MTQAWLRTSMHVRGMSSYLGLAEENLNLKGLHGMSSMHVRGMSSHLGLGASHTGTARAAPGQTCDLPGVAELTVRGAGDGNSAGEAVDASLSEMVRVLASRAGRALAAPGHACNLPRVARHALRGAIGGNEAGEANDAGLAEDI